MRNAGRITKLVWLFIAAFSVVLLTVNPAQAIQCGDTITSDTTLTANLGPCPGDALILRGSEITLDLNGHTITGSGTSTALLFDGVPEAIIKGPGTITNFATGIVIGGGSGNVMVYNLTLNRNAQGIRLGPRTYGRIRVFNNLILGRNQQGDGISVSAGTRAHIYQNTISGYSIAVFLGTEVANAVVDENFITMNQTGIWGWYPDRSCFTIRGNRVMFNQGDGIKTGIDPGAMALEMATPLVTCADGTGGDIEDNTVSFNGGNGIVVRAGYSSNQLVQDNMVSSNKENGISLIGASPSATGLVQVFGNSTTRNGIDLFWDGLGPSANYCWQQNVSGTNSPPALPGC